MRYYSTIKRFYMTVFSVTVMGSVFALSGCETTGDGSKRPSASFESGIFKGKKESRR